MKTNIIKSALLSLMVLFSALSCNKSSREPAPEPVFPDSVLNETVAAGESVDISINPNLAWEVSISGDGSGNYFWLDDAGMKATKISGKNPGAVVVTVVFSEDEEFDHNRVCDVTLTMDGKSKKIAVITRPSLARTFELYGGVAGENGFTEAYGQEKISEASLVTFPGTDVYSLPVRVVTNYSWALSMPSWIKAFSVENGDPLNQGKPGATEILLQAVLSNEICEGAEDVVKFIDANNSDASFDLKVALPSFKDRVEYTLNTTFTFNAAGDVLNNNGTYLEGLPAFFELFATPGTDVKVVEWNAEGNYHATVFADWATVTKERYDDYSEDAALAKYTVEIAVPANTTSSERLADVFVIPASKASVPFDDWFDPNTGNLKKEFSDCIIGRISQVGIEKDYLTLSENPDDVYEAVLAKYTESQWWAASLGTENQFELVYSHEYSDAVLVFDRPFASYKVFDYEFIEVEESQLETFWLSFIGFASNSKGRVTMDPSKFTRTDAEFPESFIVFYDESGKVLAGLSCRHTTKGSSVVTESIYSIASGTAEIERLSGDDEIYQAVNGNYSVTDIYKITTNDRHVFVQGQSQYEIWNAFGVDPVTFGDLDSPIILEPASPNFDLYTGNGPEKAEALFIFQKQGADGSLVNFAAIYVVYDPEAVIQMPSPFKFVNPGMTDGLAVLDLYSGDMIAQIKDEHYGMKEGNIYELKYMDASASSVAAITIPVAPVDNAAWNNYPYSEDYWLSCEVSGTQMTVYMSEAGKYDYFLFRDASGMPAYVLVCTLAQ